MKKKIKKALAPEELTALSNMQSILQELISMNQGGSEEMDMGTEEVERAEGEEVMTPEEESTEGKEVKMIIKGIEETPSDSSTASDDAEARMSEVQTEQTEENVTEVAKALLKALNVGSVKKSIKPVDPMTQALGQIVQVVKAQQEKQDVLSQTLSHILNGMGVTKQLEVAKSEQAKKSPVIDSDNGAMLKEIRKALNLDQVDRQEVHKSNSQVVKKNLGSREVLAGLLGK